MKKRLLALALAAAMALSAPMSVSAAWQRDTAGNWQWSENGTLQTGWKQISGKWYHFDQNGIMNTGWLNDNGTWYYLDNSGAMRTGWLSYNGSWYYLKPNGAMATGWQEINGQKYYLQSWGGMLTGWFNDRGNTYYLDSWGAMARNWRLVDGSWYYMNTNGIRQTGWTEVNGKRYFLDANGAMQTGIIEVDGEVYYLDESGAMVTGKVQIDRKRYEFAETGESIGARTPEPEKAFDSEGNETEITVDGGLSGGGGGFSGGSSSGGGSTGGGGSSGGSGESGGSGGSGGDEEEEKPEPPKPKDNLLIYNGTWQDTAEGIQFTANTGNHLSGGFRLQYNAHEYLPFASIKISSFEVDDLFSAPEEMEGSLDYYPEGESKTKEVDLTSATFHEETDVLTLKYQNLDMECDISLKISEDKKSIIMLGVTSELLHQTIQAPFSAITVDFDILPDTTAFVRTEQDVRDALNNNSITTIQSEGVISFTQPLIIDRDIEIFSERMTTWAYDGPKTQETFVTIKSGAEVRMTGGEKLLWTRDSSTPDITFLAVENASLQAENLRFWAESGARLLYMENASITLLAVETYKVSPIGIEMDTVKGSKSSLKIISGDIGAEKQIISGSPDSIVTLPDGYEEFINDEGQREWTNDPNKPPQPPEETEEPELPATEKPASADMEDLKPAEPITSVTE